MDNSGVSSPGRRLICTIGLLLFPFACDLSLNPAAAEPAVIGIVEGFDGGSGQYGLERNSRVQDLHICDEIEPGDKMVFRAHDGQIRIRMVSGQLRRIGPTDPQEPISAPTGEAASMGGNLLANLRDMLTPWHDFVDFNFSVRGADRSRSAGEPLDLPLVPANGASIDAGSGSFALAWNGGSPPFAITLSDSGSGEAALNVAGIESRALPERPLRLADGAYTLRVSDRTGQVVERRLTVVRPEARPRPPPDAGSAGLPPAWRTTAQAGWLAQQETGRWLLQAYLEALPLAADFEPARILADLLAAGGPVDRP